MAKDVKNIIGQLRTIEQQLSPAPWSVEALSGGIRHLQRNTDVMEEYLELADEPDRSANLPGRYNGGPLAHLRNLLPDILAVLEERNDA